MYCIQKLGNEWTIRNNLTGSVRSLEEPEVARLLEEFPCLQNSTNVRYFRNQVHALASLPG